MISLAWHPAFWALCLQLLFFCLLQHFLPHAGHVSTIIKDESPSVLYYKTVYPYILSVSMYSTVDLFIPYGTLDC